MSEKLAQIEALSEQNSLEAIQTLLEVLKDETLSEEELSAAEEAFDTVSFLYALPQTEEEERDLKLCSLIAKRMDYIEDLAFDFYEEEQFLEEAKLELEVATCLLDQAPEDQKEDRETDVEASQMVIEQSIDECAQIEQDIKEASAWIDCARTLLATEKYRTLPEECFEVLFPGDEENEEEEFDCCGSDDCGSEECVGCEECEGTGEETENAEGCCGNGGCCK